MSATESEVIAGQAIQKLLDGHSPNGITPESCGEHAAEVQAAYESYESYGTEGVYKYFESLKKQGSKLVRLTNPFHEIEVFSAYELSRMDLPDPKYLVDGVLPEGCSLLAAAPKIGKSLLALNLAYAISHGGKALGSIDVKKGRVLYMALESSKRGLKKRMNALSQNQAWPGNLHFVKQWPDKHDGGYEQLERWLQHYTDTSLIVIDTLKKIRGREKGSRSIYNEDYEALDPLTKMAERHGVSILVIHHTRKMEASDPLDLISGSQGLAGAVDNAMVMQRQRGQADAKLTIMPRDEDEAELALSFDEKLTSWKLEGDANLIQKTGERQAIVNVLMEAANAGKELSPKQIVTQTGMKSNNVYGLLHTLKESNQVVCRSYGKYTIHPMLTDKTGKSGKTLVTP